MIEQTMEQHTTTAGECSLDHDKSPQQEVVVFSFYSSFWEAGQNLKDKDRLAFYDAILNYCFLGEEPQLNGLLGAVFSLARPNIDASNRRRLAGIKGGKVLGKTKETTSKTSKVKSACASPATKEKGKEKGEKKGKEKKETKEKTKVKKQKNIFENQQVQGAVGDAPTSSAQTPTCEKIDYKSTYLPTEPTTSQAVDATAFEPEDSILPQYGTRSTESPYDTFQDFPQYRPSSLPVPSSYIPEYGNEEPPYFSDSQNTETTPFESRFSSSFVENYTTAPVITPPTNGGDDALVDQFILDLQQKLDLAYTPSSGKSPLDSTEIIEEYLPLKSGDNYVIPSNIMDNWFVRYPNIDICYHLKRMREWLSEHPSGLKDPERITSFAERWLGEEEEKKQFSLNKNTQTNHSTG